MHFNFIRILKDWTLPVAMTTGTLGYLLFANIDVLDPIARQAGPVFDKILPIFMFMILFVTFCKVDFHKMRPVRWHLWASLIQIFLIVVAMALILAYRLSGNALIFMEAVLVCIVAPCAAAAPVVTQKLGGNLEEMTTYTFLSNFITVIFIPICFPLIEKAEHITFWQAFFSILYQVTLVLVVPMLLAYFVKHFLKKLHRRIVSVKDLSYYLWGISLVIVTGTTVKNICHADTSVFFLMATALTTFAICLGQYAVGRWVGRRFGRTNEVGQALGQKNTAFAIWIAYTYLSPLSSVGPGCYILWQNTVNSIEIYQYKKAGKLQKS
ncbi:MAG: transporter [Prevotella sp.]|nr:transporter [Prevotella sp.]